MAQTLISQLKVTSCLQKKEIMSFLEDSTKFTSTSPSFSHADVASNQMSASISQALMCPVVVIQCPLLARYLSKSLSGTN
ncbi:uncharacterized protein [Macaca fascicularis]|uniref:uncharacterized protein n=1 Tax=Macaca fascicularis TaxID=9541 RepID=UPI0032B0302A